MVAARKRIWRFFFFGRSIRDVRVIHRKFQAALVLKYLGLTCAAPIRTKLAI